MHGEITSWGGHLPAKTMSMLIKINNINFIMDLIKVWKINKKLIKFKKKFAYSNENFEITSLLVYLFLNNIFNFLVSKCYVHIAIKIILRNVSLRLWI